MADSNDFIANVNKIAKALPETGFDEFENRLSNLEERNDFSNTEKQKLDNIAESATKNKSDIELLDRANHTGKQPYDTITETSEIKHFTVEERNKLDDIAESATKNKSDTYLVDRTNHTGKQSYDTITETSEIKHFTVEEKTKLSELEKDHKHDTRYYTRDESNDLLLLKEDTSKKNKAGGYAGLDSSGKIDVSQIPSLSTIDVFGAENEHDMLLLSNVGVGDQCVRGDLDTNNVYMLIQTPATNINNWKRLNISATITSVNGKIGLVVLDKSDIGLSNVANLAPNQMPISDATLIELNKKSNITDIVDNLTSTLTNKPLSANQGKVLKGYIDNLNTLLLSNDTSLDTLQEIVSFIKLNKSTLDTLGIDSIANLRTALDSKLNITDIVDNLTSTLTNKPLSANQGKILKGYIDSINTLLSSDDTNLDTLQEIVAYIKANKTNLDALADIHSKTAKTTPVDADEMMIADSTTTFSLKKISWSSIKTTIKTYLDTYFIPKVTTPTTNALAKIQADGTIKNSSVIEDANGNVGFGGVTPSTWTNSVSSKAIQLGYSTSIASLYAGTFYNNAFLGLTANSYCDVSGVYKYIANSYATQYIQASGAHYWQIAPSGTAGNAITWTNAMTLDSSGYLYFGGDIADTTTTGMRRGSSGQLILRASSGGLYHQANTNYYLVTTAGGSTSDITLKKDIELIPNSLNKILNLKGVYYEFIEEQLCTADKGKQIGVIAQDVEQEFPEIVLTNEDGIKTVRYDRLIAPMIEAIKEQNEIINKLKSRLEKLENK